MTISNAIIKYRIYFVNEMFIISYFLTMANCFSFIQPFIYQRGFPLIKKINSVKL